MVKVAGAEKMKARFPGLSQLELTRLLTLRDERSSVLLRMRKTREPSW
jgi:hypothetical protein